MVVVLLLLLLLLLLPLLLLCCCRCHCRLRFNLWKRSGAGCSMGAACDTCPYLLGGVDTRFPTSDWASGFLGHSGVCVCVLSGFL